MSHAHIQSLEPRQLFSAAGALDPTYGTGGTTKLKFNVQSQAFVTATNLLADSAGRDYVVVRSTYGTTSQSRLIQRLNADGTLDTAWTGKASATLKFNTTATNVPASQYELIDDKDRLLVLDGTLLYRFRTDGTADTSFGKKGVITLPDGITGTDLALDTSGERFYVAGQRFTGSKAARTSRATVTRILEDGQVDTTFADHGTYGSPTRAPEGIKPLYATGYDVRVFADGSLDLLASASYKSADGVYTYVGAESIRLDGRGAVDGHYGTRGVASAYLPDGDVTFDSVAPVAIRSDGTVLLQRSYGSDNPNDSGGSSNLLISGDGQRQKTVNYGGDIGPNLGLIDEADGSTLVYGATLFQLKPDGTLDQAFQSREADLAVLQQDGTVVTLARGDTRGSTDFRGFVLSRVFRTDAPVATLSAKRLKTEGHSASFTVNYRDADGIDTSSLTGHELRVVAPGGTTIRPRLFSKTTLADGSVSAVYKLLDACGKPFDAFDNGDYAVRILADQVKDTHGVATGKRTLGTLHVAIK